MSNLLKQDRQLLAHAFKFDAPINAATFTQNGEHMAFALGNGGLVIANSQTPTENRLFIDAHKGAVPAISAYADGFLSLSDDGTLNFTTPQGATSRKATFNGAWTDVLAVHPKTGAFAVADGRKVHLWTSENAQPRLLAEHNSTINALAFAPDGKGLACAHKDGATLWAWPHFEPQSNHLPWKGAHMGITISPDKRWIITAMQEGALHMWQLSLKRDYQMRGYWVRPTSMAWSPDGKWLATSGADSAVIWPFDKAGPEGREALQLGWSNGALVSAVAAHPREPIIVAGFEDGALALIDLKAKKSYNISAPSGSPITTCAFAPMGSRLVAGAQNGGAIFIDLEG